jgi:hypothetical protein
MAKLQPQGGSLATLDGRLRVDFQWRGDRFIHGVFLDGVEVGSSIEGGEHDAWPPSPPIQQLSFEQIDGSDVILGVGAAGRSHWSISVELDRDGLIKFDLACRCKDEVGFLGSTYQLADAIFVTSADASPKITGRNVTIPAARQEAETRRWQYSLNPASAD